MAITNLHVVETQVRRGSTELEYVDVMVEKDGNLNTTTQRVYHFNTQDVKVDTTTSPVVIEPDTGFDGITSVDICFTNSVKPEKLYRYRFGTSVIVLSTVKLLDTDLQVGDQIKVYNNSLGSLTLTYAGPHALYVEDGETKAFMNDSYYGFTWGTPKTSPDGRKIEEVKALIDEYTNGQ